MPDVNPPSAPATPHPPGRWASRRRWACVLVVLGLVGVAVAMWLRPHPAPADPPPDDDDDTVLPAPNPGYVGIDGCAECHAQRAAEFRPTRHARACTTAAGTTAPGFAPGKGLHRARVPGMYYEMARAGADLLVSGVHQTPDGEDRVGYQVGLVYGAAGTRDEIYFAWEGDRLVQLPLAWLYPQGRWGNIDDRIRGREVPPSCLDCHNTWAGHVPGTPNQYDRDGMLLGVTCERCHGPGRDHVEHHRAHPGAPAHAVIHPGTLDRERSVDVCAQCHGNVRHRNAPFSYRPGQSLDATYRTVHSRDVEDDVNGNQVQYLRASKCFQKSEMTCVTCHDPHRPQDHAAVRRVCLDCHAPAACKERPRLPDAVRDDCAACHMPARFAMTVFFHTADDEYMPVAPRTEHRIAAYPEATQTVRLAWHRTQTDAKDRAEADRLAAELAQHWAGEADRFAKSGRLMAAIGAAREAVKVSPDDATRGRLRAAIARQSEFDSLRKRVDLRRPDDAVDLLKKALAIKPDYAIGRANLGRAYAALGKNDEAAAEFRSVATHDPNNADGLILLAWMEYAGGRFHEAVTLNARADEIEPGNVRVHYQWGLALLGLEKWADAEGHFRRCLTTHPRHAGAANGLSAALRQQGQTAEAVRHAERAVRWTGGRDAESLLTLARAYHSAGRPADARRTLDDALAEAEMSNPRLVPAIRAELSGQ